VKIEVSLLRAEETRHRLIEWTDGQTPSERLAAQVLLNEGFTELDPIHPLGGRDGGKDAIAVLDGARWIMAVYFPRGQQSTRAIRKKFFDDLEGVTVNAAVGMAFVTNQELRESERKFFQRKAGPITIRLYHLDRLVTILDSPPMTGVREQLLHIPDRSVEAQLQRLEDIQTGGNSFCYWMLYHFDLTQSVAHNFVIIRKGEYPLYDVRLRIRDMNKGVDVVERLWGEMNSPADYLLLEWPLAESVYYRIFFHARNGSWNQDLLLRRSEIASCWLAATRVLGIRGEVRFEHIDNEFTGEFGQPVWRQ
jgi:hypothetical protein